MVHAVRREIKVFIGFTLELLHDLGGDTTQVYVGLVEFVFLEIVVKVDAVGLRQVDEPRVLEWDGPEERGRVEGGLPREVNGQSNLFLCLHGKPEHEDSVYKNVHLCRFFSDRPCLFQIDILVDELLQPRRGGLDGEHAAVHAGLFQESDGLFVHDIPAESVGEVQLDLDATVDDRLSDRLYPVPFEVEHVVHDDDLADSVSAHQDLDLLQDAFGASGPVDLSQGFVAIRALIGTSP